MKIIFVIIIAIIFLNQSIAQDTIRLVNGKKEVAQDIQTDTLGVLIYRNTKGKVKVLPKEEIFSVVRILGEEIIYKPDSSADSFTIAQMNDFVTGRFDGNRHYNCKWPIAGGFSTGLIAAVGLPFLGTTTVLSPLFPAGFSIFTGVKKINETNLKIPADYKDNRYYIEGYKASIKRKKINQSIIGGGAGLVVGLIITVLIFDLR